MKSPSLLMLLVLSLLAGCVLYMGIGTIAWLSRMFVQGALIGVVIFVAVLATAWVTKRR